eukprot:6753633-Prymnesium_polylepis.1
MSKVTDVHSRQPALSTSCSTAGAWRLRRWEHVRVACSCDNACLVATCRLRCPSTRSQRPR